MNQDIYSEYLKFVRKGIELGKLDIFTGSEIINSFFPSFKLNDIADDIVNLKG